MRSDEFGDFDNDIVFGSAGIGIEVGGEFFEDGVMAFSDVVGNEGPMFHALRVDGLAFEFGRGGEFIG